MQEEARHPAAQGDCSFEAALGGKSQEKPVAFLERAGLGSNSLLRLTPNANTARAGQTGHWPQDKQENRASGAASL